MKFLIVECLSPELAHMARSRGFHESVLLALAELAESEPINEVIEITVGPEGSVRVDRYDWPTRR